MRIKNGSNCQTKPSTTGKGMMRRSAFGCFFVQRFEPRQLLADFDFQPARDGLVEIRFVQAVGHIAFAGGVGVRFVVGVAVFASVAQFLHQFGRCVAQVDGYFVAGVFFDEAAHLVVCLVARVGFRGGGKVQHGLRQREFAFGRA